MRQNKFELLRMPADIFTWQLLIPIDLPLICKGLLSILDCRPKTAMIETEADYKRAFSTQVEHQENSCKNILGSRPIH